jgi:hypothetical protein
MGRFTGMFAGQTAPEPSRFSGMFANVQADQEEPTRSVGGFLTNLGGNAVQLGSDLYAAASNPIETVKALGKTGVGAVQEFIPGDQEYETQYFEPFVRSVGGDLGFKSAPQGQGIAGSNVDWSADKLKQNLYERPLDVGMSASMPLAPATALPGKVGRASRITSSALNPAISLPVKGVTSVAKGVGGVTNVAKNVPGVGAAAKKVTNVLNPRLAAVRDLPTTEQFKSRSNAIYSAAEAQGVTFTQNAWGRLHTGLSNKLRSEGFKAERHPDAARELKLLEDDLKAGNLSLRGLEQTRSEISRKARDLRKAGNDTDARQLEIMGSYIDDFMDKAKSGDVVGGTNPQAAVKLFEEARGVYKKKIKSERLDELEYQAQLDAGANYTQAGVEHALRRRVRNILRNKNERKLWSPDEIKAMEDLVKKGKVARGLGKMAPTGAIPTAAATGTGGTIGGALGFLAGGPAGAAVGSTVGAGATMAAGALGKRASTTGTRARIDRLKGTVRSGQALPDATPGYAKASVPAATVATRQQALEHSRSVLGDDVLSHLKKDSETRGILNDWVKARQSGERVEEATWTLAVAVASEVQRPELTDRIFAELSQNQ